MHLCLHNCYVQLEEKRGAWVRGYSSDYSVADATVVNSVTGVTVVTSVTGVTVVTSVTSVTKHN